MPIDSKHPEWDDREDDWKIMRDAARGETAVKAEGEVYLPMPNGFRGRSDGGASYYESYKLRAQFPELLTPTLDGMVGLIHLREAQITMPPSMDPLWEKATKDGMTLEEFHQRITREILQQGRWGVLVDAPVDGADIPYLCGFKAESIINWDEMGRTLYVLDESQQQTSPEDEFEWEDVIKYRVLRWDGATYTQQEYEVDENGIETVKAPITPSAKAGKALPEIPFVVAGPRGLTVKPESPPLYGVAKAALAIYRLDADYRWQLYMGGQETLVLTGVDPGNPPPEHVGAGVMITLGVGSEAKYVGPSGATIAAHRTAIQDERENAVASGAKLFERKREGVESGEALRVRASTQQATLTTVAISSAKCLERALRFAATFMGIDPEEVTVKPNLTFVDSRMTPQEASELVKAWQAGAISYETLYENLQRGGIASEERDAEEERDLIEQETPDPPVLAPEEGEEPEGGGAPGDEDEDLDETVPGAP